MRPERRGKRPAPPTTPVSCDESPLRMWTPVGETSPMCVEMGLRSVESSRSSVPSTVQRTPTGQGITPAQGQVQVQTQSKVVEQALKGEVDYYKGLSQHYAFVINEKLAGYFSGLATVLQSHLWLSQEGFLPHAQQQVVTDAETAALTLRNKLLSLEASSLTRHEEDLAATTQLKLQVSGHTAQIASLEQELSTMQKLIKKQSNEIEAHKAALEALEVTVRAKEDRLKKQFENHHSQLVELKEERDIVTMQTKHRQQEAAATIKRLKVEVSSLKEELEKEMSEGKALRLQTGRAERKAEANIEKLKKFDATLSKAKTLAGKCQGAYTQCCAYCASYEDSARSLIALDESTAYARLVGDHHQQQVELREVSVLKREVHLQQSLNAHSNSAGELRAQQQSAAQQAEASEALFTAMQEELHLKTGTLNTTLQGLHAKELQCAELAAAHEALEHQLRERSAQCSEVADQHTLAQDSLATANSEKANISRRLLELEEQLHVVTKSCEGLGKAKGVLEEQLREAKAASTRLLTKMEDAAGELVDTKQELESLRVKHDSLGKAAEEVQGELQGEINTLRRALNEYDVKLKQTSCTLGDYEAVRGKLRTVEAELAESHGVADMLDALNEELEKYHVDNVALREEVLEKGTRLAGATAFKQKYVAAERARKVLAEQVQRVRDDYESTVGTVTSTTPTHVRADTTSRFMVRVRAWYRGVRLTCPDSLPPPSPSPPPVPTQRTTPAKFPSPSLDRWGASSSRSRSVSPALSL